MLVEHFVHKVSNLHVPPNQRLELGAPCPAQVVQLAQARQQRFVAAGQPHVVEHALGDLVVVAVVVMMLMMMMMMMMLMMVVM